jgi:hypothetical protein
VVGRCDQPVSRRNHKAIKRLGNLEFGDSERHPRTIGSESRKINSVRLLLTFLLALAAGGVTAAISETRQIAVLSAETADLQRRIETLDRKLHHGKNELDRLPRR